MIKNAIVAKDVSTLLPISIPLQLDDGTTTVYSLEFRHVIDSLQYFSITCLDISYIVNKLSQFMGSQLAPMEQQKKLIRYLKLTIFRGIHLTQPKLLILPLIQMPVGLEI